MPQMKPMYWLVLLFYMGISMLFYLIKLNYFCMMMNKFYYNGKEKLINDWDIKW